MLDRFLPEGYKIDVPVELRTQLRGQSNAEIRKPGEAMPVQHSMMQPPPEAVRQPACGVVPHHLQM